jgi:hypothetical protein
MPRQIGIRFPAGVCTTEDRLFWLKKLSRYVFLSLRTSSVSSFKGEQIMAIMVIEEFHRIQLWIGQQLGSIEDVE